VSDSFRVEGTTQLLRSHIFDVERRVIGHDGSTFERDVVIHRGAVAVLAINERGEIGLIRQYRAPFDRYNWEIPAGALDVEGEDPLRCAKRELLEEMGCAAQRWTLLGRFLTSPGWTDQVMTIFEARDLRIGPRQPSGPEETSSTVHWLAPGDLRDTLRGEPAVDATMVVALNRVFGTFFDGI
jgi:8-oxo-dGTP pyrophosphatase MutT (NUDIX family)